MATGSRVLISDLQGAGSLVLAVAAGEWTEGALTAWSRDRIVPLDEEPTG
jgi:hypothetical protein